MTFKKFHEQYFKCTSDQNLLHMSLFEEHRHENNTFRRKKNFFWKNGLLQHLTVYVKSMLFVLFLARRKRGWYCTPVGRATVQHFILDCIKFVLHLLITFHRFLRKIQRARIKWTNEPMRRAMHELISGFLNCYGFANRTKIRSWRLEVKFQQLFKYDGFHHMHFRTAQI